MALEQSCFDAVASTSLSIIPFTFFHGFDGRFRHSRSDVSKVSIKRAGSVQALRFPIRVSVHLLCTYGGSFLR